MEDKTFKEMFGLDLFMEWLELKEKEPESLNQLKENFAAVADCSKNKSMAAIYMVFYAGVVAGTKLAYQLEDAERRKLYNKARKKWKGLRQY